MTDYGAYALLALTDGPTHSYGILKRMRDSYGINIATGTLYGSVIPRLEKTGYIEIYHDPSNNIATYQWEITNAGLEFLATIKSKAAQTVKDIENAI